MDYVEHWENRLEWLRENQPDNKRDISRAYKNLRNARNKILEKVSGPSIGELNKQARKVKEVNGVEDFSLSSLCEL